MITHAGKKVVVEIDLDAETAADDAGHWLGHAATIFDAISAGISSGHLSANDAFLISLSEVCARAFRSVADDEGERLQGVAMAIRDDRARAMRCRKEDNSILHEDADAAQAKGDLQRASYLRAIARGEIDPLEPDGVPKWRKPADERKEASA